MSGGRTRILLIEDNRAQARLIREQLSDVKSGLFEIDAADRLSEGLSQLGNGNFSGVLLDLSLPDSQGLQTLDAVRAKAPDIAVVVLTGLSDEALGTVEASTGVRGSAWRSAERRWSTTAVRSESSPSWAGERIRSATANSEAVRPRDGKTGKKNDNNAFVRNADQDLSQSRFTAGESRRILGH